MSQLSQIDFYRNPQMFVRSQPKIHKLDLSINTEALGSEPDCSMTSDHRRKFFRKPDAAVRQDSSRQKRNHCQVKAFAGFFSPNNQHLTQLVREKSGSDLRKLLFRNILQVETHGEGESQRQLGDCKTASEQVLTTMNKSLYHYRTDRRKTTESNEKENQPSVTSRKSIGDVPEKQLTESQHLRFEVEKLRDENADLKSRLALTRKQLTEKSLKKQASSDELESLYKKSLTRIKELNDELSSGKLKIVRLEAESRTKQEVIGYMERTIKSLTDKVEDLTMRERAIQSRLEASERQLLEVQERLQQNIRELASTNCRLWTAQQKNSELDLLRQQLKRYSNVAQVNKQLRQLNNQLTHKLQRISIVKDHELFSLSSEENI